jgi:hypothetical protein
MTGLSERSRRVEEVSRKRLVTFLRQRAVATTAIAGSAVRCAKVAASVGRAARASRASLAGRIPAGT